MTVFGVVVTAAVARAEIEFIGILSMPPKKLFALTDTATDKTAWVSLGEAFGEHKLTAYDAPTDTVTLNKPGVEMRIHLKDDAKIKSARMEITGTITLGGEEPVEVERATLFFDQENVFPLKDGVTYRITPKRLEDGILEYSIAIEQTVAPNKTEKLSAPRIRVLPGHPFSLRVGEAGFAFTPR
jgi:hypothetical protein